MSAFTITLYIVGILLNAFAAIKFRWSMAITAEDRISAAVRGNRVVGKSWPFGTLLVRLLTGTAAIYLAVTLALALGAA
jgi:hypothetical protein